MIYIPLNLVRPGMILAQDVSSGTLYLPLLTSGQPLSSAVIRRLESGGVSGVYVESSLSGEPPVELIAPKQKKRLLSDLERVFTSYSSSNANMQAICRNVSKMASDLMLTLLAKDELLVNVVDIRDYDNYTYYHSVNVALISVLIGRQIGLPKLGLNDLAIAGLMHDIGKVDLPIEIINKPSKLTDDEFSLIKTHPSNAWQHLRTNSAFSLASLLAIEGHHEKYDGTGYPKGLEGDQISLYGRILALADVFDALTSNRPYRRGWPPAEAIEYMTSCGGTHFDFTLLQAFLNVVSAYPEGTVVALSNGWTAIVIENKKGHTLRPKVRVALPLEERGREVDLANDRDYLNVVIEKTLNDFDSLPEGLYDTAPAS